MPYRKLRYSGEDLPLLREIDPSRVITMSSFSKLLSPGIRVGFMISHSDLIGAEETVRRLSAGGLAVDVLERRRGALGPLLTARLPQLEARGLLRPGQREEDLLIVRGAAADAAQARPAYS